jgi:hypothetical protein
MDTGQAVQALSEGTAMLSFAPEHSAVASLGEIAPESQLRLAGEVFVRSS